MMKISCSLIIVFLFTVNVTAQTFIWSPDSLLQADPNYGMDRYHDILRYHDPLMYAAFPFIKPVVDRSVELKEGEGKNGFWIEGQFGYRFTIYHGKYYSFPFFQRSRFTFDVNLMPRMTKDDSSPLLPFNNKFGFGFDYLLSGLKKLKKEKAILLWSTLQLHHYSNGEADSFFLNTSPKRNNYADGDFSTNYLRFMLSISNSNQQKNITTYSLGFQREVDLGGPLSMSRELDRYYGKSRALGAFQWTQKPRLVTLNYANRATTESDTVKLTVRRQVSFRTELEYIMDDVSLFPYENKARLGWHNYLAYMPSVTNEVGVIIHTYLGRDYLNIRFDDVVFIGELGLFIKFNLK